MEREDLFLFQHLRHVAAAPAAAPPCLDVVAMNPHSWMCFVVAVVEDQEPGLTWPMESWFLDSWRLHLAGVGAERILDPPRVPGKQRAQNPRRLARVFGAGVVGLDAL